jgi:Mrp family chromosome partitioning ATPase
MDRARTLADDGIYSKREYEKAKASYEQERFLLYKDSPSASLYKEMTLRELDVQLAHISDQQKVAHLREAVEHVHDRLDSLPLVQRDYLALSREVAIRATEREHIDQLLGLARRENESQSLGFSVVSVATPPLLPLNSNRKVVFVALTVFGTLLGFLLALLLELFDRRLRCVGDARAKLHSEVLAGFQHGDIELSDVTDESLTLVNRLRHLGMKAGSKVMIVSATPGEGAPEVARLLALTLATASDATLLVDARFREIDAVPPAARLFLGWRRRVHVMLQHLRPELFFPTVRHSETSLTVSAESQVRPGLSELLTNPEDHRELGVCFKKDVRLLPVGLLARPELLLSRRLNAVLEANLHKSEVLLINTAPVRDFPDATFLAPCINSAIMVAAAGKVTAENIERCISLLEAAGIAVLGVVVTNISEAFAEKRPA